MQILQNKQFSVNPGFCVLVALFLLLLPLKWVVSWFLAAAAHELCHCAALTLCGVRIYTVRIGFSGAEIETEPMSARQEIVSALAGPAGGLLLLSLLRLTPTIAICALFQSAYNLLPIFPLDGGRALYCFISSIWGETRAAAISNALSGMLCLLLLALILFAAFIFKLGLCSVACVILLILRNKHGKSPCKPAKQIVQ